MVIGGLAKVSPQPGTPPKAAPTNAFKASPVSFMSGSYTLQIESVDYEARGVAHIDGKVIFVDGALPGETVLASPYRKKSKFENAQLIKLFAPSSARVTPLCRHYSTCGGCSMQHADVRTQVAIKQRVLEDNLRFIGKVVPETMLRAIHGPSWGYRYRARLSVRHVPSKGGVLIGFHEKKSSYVVDMRDCPILPLRIAALLLPLRELVAGLSIKERLPQFELAVGSHVDVLVARILAPLTTDDEEQVKRFAEAHQVQFWLQPDGPSTAYPFWPPASACAPLSYELPEFNVTMPFKPTDFTQVNHQINEVLVSRALRLLGVQPHERVGDFFCGLGNFTLPLARQAREVVGVEGSAPLVARARDNAAHNGLAANTSFHTANLFEATPESLAQLGRFERILIDPPRDGALYLLKAIGALGQADASWRPKRIVYVSCSPSTLARDAGLLHHEYGYTLKSAGIVNMFPHTSHVESIAVFEPQ